MNHQHAKRHAFGWWRGSKRAAIPSVAPRNMKIPQWWHEDWHRVQQTAALLLESKEAHWIIIVLVLLDLTIVITELSLSGFYPAHCPVIHVPHSVHKAETALSWTSISILIIFNIELVAKFIVFGTHYFRSIWHVLDATVILTSLVLELVLKGVSAEIASLLVFFRRVVLATRIVADQCCMQLLLFTTATAH